MKLTEIIELWNVDSIIDRHRLDEESIKIPLLHAKYLELYINARKKMREMEIHKKLLFQERWEAVVARNGKAPDHDIRITKSELEKYYVEADDILQQYEYKLNEQQSKINYLNSVMKSIDTRSFIINNAIKWSIFISGG